MNANVTPKIGYYQVQVHPGQNVQVGRDKQCTCGGGTAQHPCMHIQAVADYLRRGGCRAASVPTCPICNAPVERLGPDFWRCSQDSSHYWQWRGERNGSALCKFFTQPHPAKLGAFYEQTVEEREAFLAQAAERMYAGGHTSMIKEESEMYQTQETVRVRQRVASSLAMTRKATNRCYLCGVPILADNRPLCPDCERDEAERREDHRAEQEQVRRPF